MCLRLEKNMSKAMKKQIRDAQRYLDFLRNVNGPFTQKETERFRKEFDNATKLSLSFM